MNRLYYDDSYLRRFSATAETGAGDLTRVYLDRTAFYPTSGGQPYDTGSIGPARVIDVSEEDDGRVAHVLDRTVEPGWYPCEIDWPRRFDHMQQHTGQHLLSAVLADEYKIPTVSFHLGAESSTIDVEASQLDPERLSEVERRANALIFENRPVTVSYHDAREDLKLRKPTDRDGTIRVVSIEDLDRSACGGTHVAATGEIGPLLIRKLDKIRGNPRIEFLCGHRAIERARTDFDALASIARRFSAPLDQAAALVNTQADRLAEAGKLARKLSTELAAIRGRELHAATAPGEAGLRMHVREIAKGPIEDDVRVEAQAFAAAGGAVFAALCADPASILLCVSPDAPIKAGPTLKEALAAVGGRGGGNAVMAQGSVPGAEALAQVWTKISSCVPR
jgi:alanyl-tRNA synthetase